MDVRETPVAKAGDSTEPESYPEIYLPWQYFKLSLSKKKSFWQILTYAAISRKQRGHPRFIWLLPKQLCSINKTSMKCRGNIKIEIWFNMNLKWKMTWSICLPTKYRNKNNSMMLREKVNMVKSEQCTALTGVKRVTVFQASLKLLREEAGGKLSNDTIKNSTSQRLKYLHVEGCCK